MVKNVDMKPDKKFKLLLLADKCDGHSIHHIMCLVEQIKNVSVS